MAKRRTRRGPEPQEFNDPLKNYTSPDYSDEFERSLCEDKLDVIEQRPYVSVRPDAVVIDVLRQMAEANIACVVVIDEDQKPVGILSEQDVVRRIAEDFDRYAQEPISAVMTTNPLVAYESETPSRAMNIMGSGYFRHLPVCDLDGRLTGVIGARRLTAYLQQYVSDVWKDE